MIVHRIKQYDYSMLVSEFVQTHLRTTQCEMCGRYFDRNCPCRNSIDRDSSHSWNENKATITRSYFSTVGQAVNRMWLQYEVDFTDGVRMSGAATEIT